MALCFMIHYLGARKIIVHCPLFGFYVVIGLLLLFVTRMQQFGVDPSLCEPKVVIDEYSLLGIAILKEV
jgi:hypothetical protein